MEEALPAERQVDEIESLCMNCHENGMTRLLLTRIPFFREIVIMSFECPECHFKNAEIQSAGEIQQRGIRYKFRLESVADLQRQVVKSDTCVFRIEDIDLEIPAGRGQLTNLEGLLSMVRQDLEAKQDERREVDETLATQVQGVIESLTAMLEGKKFPLTITVDDPAGNSTVEPAPSDRSGKYVRVEYPRTAAQNSTLGLGEGSEDHDEATQQQDTGAPATNIRPEYHASQLYPAGPNGVTPHATPLNITDDEDIVENEVYSFPASCPGCTAPCTTNMKMVRIPHFSEVVLMSTVCEHCGYRSNEVKSGGVVPALGRRITLAVETAADLSRDILKAESCALACPELSLSVEPGTLGGRFTTVEGLLTQVRDDLRASIFDTDDDNSGRGTGDSMQTGQRSKWTEFFAGLDAAIAGDRTFTIVLEDPLAGSYVQSFTAPEPDRQITVEDYQRSEQEEEDLGLRDIKTEGYEVDEKEETKKENGAKEQVQDGKQEIDAEEIAREIRARLGGLDLGGM